MKNTLLEIGEMKLLKTKNRKLLDLAIVLIGPVIFARIIAAMIIKNQSMEIYIRTHSGYEPVG